MFHPDPYAASIVEQLGEELNALDPIRSCAVVGGLLTLPSLQANAVRLETLSSAIAATGAGERVLGRGRLTTWLNSELSSLALMEDPSEDAFLLPVLTEQGEFRVFEGVFEKNAVTTECLIEALVHLADEAPTVTPLIHEAYSLMSLSEALAVRARMPRNSYGGGANGADLTLPPSDRLSTLARRVRFTKAELHAANVPSMLLKPYLSDARLPAGARSALRHAPIVFDGTNFVVAAPSFLPAAWRRRVAVEAQSAEWGPRLAEKLLFAVLRRFEESGFDRLPERILTEPLSPFVTTTFIRDHGPGRWVNLIVVSDGFHGAVETGVDGLAPDSDKIDDYLAKTVADAETFAKQKPGFVGGVHLIALAGWGRGLAARLPKAAPGWTILHAPANDLATIGALGVTLDDLWRIEQQRDRLARANIHLANLNGTLNLVEYWRATDHLLTPNAEDVAAPVRIAVGNHHVLDARREAFDRLGLRALPWVADGPYLRARRKATASWFCKPTDLAQYASMEMVVHRETVGAVALDGTPPIWIIVPKACGPVSHRVVTFETALNWTERVVKALSGIGKSHDQIIHLTFEIPAEAAIEDYEAASRDTLAAIDDSIRVRIGENEATFTLTEGWFGRWRDKSNIAERSLAERILLVVAQLSGLSLNAASKTRLMASIVPDDRARFQHALVAQTFYDLIQSSDRPQYRDLPISAAALAKTGLVWDALGRDVFGRLPESDALPTIRATVQHLLHRVSERAGALDHPSLLRRILRRYEGAAIDERHWMDTAGAALALADDRSAAEAVLRDRMWAGTAVRVGSRLLAEIVGSTPPAANAKPLPEANDVDVDELLADAVLALHMGDLHAEIENGMTPPEVVVALSGEVLSDQSFGAAVVQPMGVRTANKKISHQARRYDTRVTDAGTTPAVDHLFSDDYGRALEAEYGLTLDGIRLVRDALEDLGLECGEAVIRLRRSDLLRQLIADRDLPEAAVSQFLDRLSMPVRTNWSTPPDSFTAADVEPWRSGRRLAFFARPLLRLDRKQDPELMIAPGVVAHAINWQVRQAHEGSVAEAFWCSPEMKVWARNAAAREAAAFAQDVGERLVDLGLEVQVEVLASKILNAKAPGELGDIDVFAIDRTSNRAWVIEVKDLGLCRSQREIALRLTDYAGRVKSGGRPDPMLRHLRRVRYIREHAAALAKQNSLSEPVDVRGLLVVSTPQPMTVVEPDDPDARVVLVDDLKSEIVHGGG